jgi:hypothetical protein
LSEREQERVRRSTKAMWPTLATTLVAVASAATAAASGSVGPGAHQDGKYNVLFIVVDSEFYLRFQTLAQKIITGYL